MTQVPSSGHTEDCPRYEDQEMFTPCMIGQLEAQFFKDDGTADRCQENT